jgi:polyisoprenoid-binding protein YceI
MTTTRLMALAALTLAPVSALAQAPTWQADVAHTQIGFAVRHMMVTTVKGEFGKYTVAVKGDPRKPAGATIAVTIDVASVDSRNAKRDAHLRSPDFFDVAKYPTITFVSKQVARAGKGGLKVTGDLTIKGKTKTIVLAVKNLVGPVKDPWGKERLGFSATATIDRRDFGLTWNKVLASGGVLVSHDVTITIEAQLIAAKQ